MKKILIITSILITSVYLSSAVNIVLTSGTKLNNSSWDNLSSVLNKVDINSGDINIDWKLVVNWKICLDDGNCLGKCKKWYYWDNATSLCKQGNWNSEKSAGFSCYTIKQSDNSKVSWTYWIDPDWLWTWNSSFQVYCDMLKDWWGWTYVVWITNNMNHFNQWESTPENLQTI